MSAFPRALLTPGATASSSGNAETTWLRHRVHCWTSQQWHPPLGNATFVERLETLVV